MTARLGPSRKARARVWQRGDAIVEFAYTLPLILILLTFVFYLVRGAVAVLWVDTLLPADARTLGTRQGVSGQMGALPLTGAAARSVSAEPACDRAQRVTAGGTATQFTGDALGWLSVRLRAGSITRVWGFYAEPPTGGCQ